MIQIAGSSLLSLDEIAIFYIRSEFVEMNIEICTQINHQLTS